MYHCALSPWGTSLKLFILLASWLLSVLSSNVTLALPASPSYDPRPFLPSKPYFMFFYCTYHHLTYYIPAYLLTYFLSPLFRYKLHKNRNLVLFPALSLVPRTESGKKCEHNIYWKHRLQFKRENALSTRVKANHSSGNPVYLFLVLFAVGFLPEVPVMIQGGIFVQLGHCGGAPQEHQNQPFHSVKGKVT